MQLLTDNKYMRKGKGLVKKIAVAFAALFLICSAVIFCLLEPRVEVGLPHLDRSALTDYVQSANVLAADDSPLKTQYNKKGRAFTTANDLNAHTVAAFVAVEDKRFFRHKGIDYKRVGGALVEDVKTLSFKEGASTITQQLIKNTHLNNKKTIGRKLSEARIARESERVFSKAEILDFYLNSLYFGNGAYGIEEGARYYFDKVARELSIAQSALLAAIINSPAHFNPIKNPKLAKGRRDMILDLMSQQGYITSEQCEQAKSEGISVRCVELFDPFRAYVQEAAREAASIVGDISGYTVKTYLDASLQRLAFNELCAIKASNVLASATVIDNEQFGISVYASTSNLPLRALKRQPASTFKPIGVFAPALESGVASLNTELNNTKKTYENNYSPSNYLDKYTPSVSLREALSRSYNIPAVELMDRVGIVECKRFALNAGYTFDERDTNLALALGGMTYGVDLVCNTASYCAFSCGGEYKKPAFVREILDSEGRTVYRNNQKKVRIMKQSTADAIGIALVEAAEEGTARRLKNVGFEVAAKTGTVGGKLGNTDAYCISYSSKKAVGVWIGAPSAAEPMDNIIKGGGYPTVINRAIIKKAHQKTPPPFDFKAQQRAQEPSLRAQNNLDRNNIQQKGFLAQLKRLFGIGLIIRITR